MIKEYDHKRNTFVDNPALTTMVGHQFRHALTEYGFTEVPETIFTKENVPVFHESMPELPASQKLTAKQLIKPLHRGTVSDVKTLTDGTTLWTVSFQWLHYDCTCQLSHRHDHWKIGAHPEVQRLQQSRHWTAVSWLLGSKGVFAFDVAVVALLTVASFILGSVWASDSEVNHPVVADDSPFVELEDAIQFVEDQGHFVLTGAEREQLVTQIKNEAYEQARQEISLAKENTVAEEEKSEEKEKAKEESKDGAKDEPKEEPKEEKTTFVFTMQKGMPVGELVNALEERGFIKDKQKFIKRMEEQDLITNVDVGEYKFTHGMSEDELLKVLE